MPESVVEELYDSFGMDYRSAFDGDFAHVEIHQNKVIGVHLVPGLEVETEERPDGIEAQILVKAGARIEKPVHMCFGMLPRRGRQRIVLRTRVEEQAGASILAHCTFPNAVEVEHSMEAETVLGRDAEYSYFERHVHGREGGVLVVPKAKVHLEEGARFRTEFELVRGRVGRIDIDYETTCLARSVMEMTARISGSGDDEIKIREIGHLVGEGARGVLTSYVALRDEARAEIFNKLTAEAAHARGHVDCKEVVQDSARANAVPVVEVSHPKAHITHEAAIGSVDSTQLQTLMARGLTEDEATDLIVQGLLS
jgi:Fe-S cluster assembly scaffold protein SufB